MPIKKTTRRSFPFFRQELRVVLEDLDSSESLKELARKIPDFFRPEISNIFEINNKQSLKNLRGRPEISNDSELGSEILFRVRGRSSNEHSQEQVKFEATVETKFKEFNEGAIFYNLYSSFPDGFEFTNFTDLIESSNVEIATLEIGLDYYENREFPFLGMKLQELRERLYLSLSEQPSGTGSKLSGVIENNNTQTASGFSKKVRAKIGYLAQITGIPELAEQINE